MSGAEKKTVTVLTLLWPYSNPDNDIVAINIDVNLTLSHLKDMIKVKHAPTLDNVAAHHLLLWNYSSIPQDTLKTTLKTIRFDDSDNRIVRLNFSWKTIQKFFGDVKKPICIFVKHGASECGTRISINDRSMNITPRK